MSNEIQTADEILKQIEAVAAVEKEVPPGYQRIVMSTKGKYGAPPVLHLRNFSIEEALVPLIDVWILVVSDFKYST